MKSCVWEPCNRTGMISKAMAAVAALVIALCGLTLLSGCSPANSEEVIRGSIADQFDKYKNHTDEVMSELSTTAENEGLTDLGISGEEFAAAVLDGFDYTIDSIQIDGDKATATLTITSKSMKDFETRLTESMNEFVDSDNATEMTEEDANAKIGELAMQAFDNTQIISEQAVLEYELQGNTWTATNASEVLGGLDSMVFAN